MKKGIGIYGLVTVAAILLLTLVTYFFDKDAGFLKQVSEIKPSSQLTSQDQSELIEDVTQRRKPTLTATVKKLEKGKSYNLLNEFGITAQNADKESLEVTVEVLASDGTSMDASSFHSEKSGIYTVYCHTQEEYKTFVLETDATYRFMVD